MHFQTSTQHILATINNVDPTRDCTASMYIDKDKNMDNLELFINRHQHFQGRTLRMHP
jgi:hypothetical protein